MAAEELVETTASRVVRGIEFHGIVERVSLSIRSTGQYRFATPTTPGHELFRASDALARFVKCRQRLGQRRGSSAADQRARRKATAIRRRSFELRPPRAGEVAPARDGSWAPQDLPGGARAEWERAAPLRRGRVRALPALRHSRQRLRSRALCRLRRRAARRVLLQEPWNLSVLHDAKDAGHRHAPGRSRAAVRSGAPVGAVASALGSLSAGARPRADHAHPASRPARHLRAAAVARAPAAPRRRQSRCRPCVASRQTRENPSASPRTTRVSRCTPVSICMRTIGRAWLTCAAMAPVCRSRRSGSRRFPTASSRTA